MSGLRYIAVVLLLLAAGCGDPITPIPELDELNIPQSSETCDQPGDEGYYLLTFDTDWDDDVFDPYPVNAHFSPLIGTAHNSSYRMWQPGDTSTDGIEAMAEDGLTNPLAQEINAGDNTIGAQLGTQTFAPGTVVYTVQASYEFPLYSVVTMIAPSPDWFVGVDSLDLCDGSEWVESVTLDAFVYDAGTDDGTTFNAANDDTDPRGVIELIDGAPFDAGEGGATRRVGTFTFERQ